MNSLSYMYEFMLNRIKTLGSELLIFIFFLLFMFFFFLKLYCAAVSVAYVIQIGRLQQSTGVLYLEFTHVILRKEHVYTLISYGKQRDKTALLILGVIFKALFNSKHSNLSIYSVNLSTSKNQIFSKLLPCSLVKSLWSITLFQVKFIETLFISVATITLLNYMPPNLFH